MNIISATARLRSVSQVSLHLALPEPERIDRQRIWLQAVLAAKGWQATELARRASLSPSTVTRFLNDASHPHALSDRTLDAIEAASGFRRYEMPDPALEGFAEPDATPYDAGAGEAGGPTAAAVQALLAGHSGRVPWRLIGRSLETAGYLAGDIAIVDLAVRARAGDPVCAQVYDWSRPERTITVMRIFNPPVLVGATLDATAIQPLMVDDKHVAIKGVIVASLRARGH